MTKKDKKNVNAMFEKLEEDINKDGIEEDIECELELNNAALSLLTPSVHFYRWIEFEEERKLKCK